MIERKFILVTDADANQIERAAGLRGHPTVLGVLLERPAEFNLDARYIPLGHVT